MCEVKNEIINHLFEALKQFDGADHERIRVTNGGQATDGPWIRITVREDAVRDAEIAITIGFKVGFDGTGIHIDVTDEALYGSKTESVAEVPLANPAAFSIIIDDVKEIILNIYLAKRKFLRRKAKKVRRDVIHAHRIVKMLHKEEK
jgi:hypothetical protein